MKTYPSTLLIIMTMTLLYPSTIMSEPWKKFKNQTEITCLAMVPQNQLVNTHYPNDLPTVTCCPANVNRCIPPFKKTQVSSDPVLLISPVPHLCNITLTLLMLNPSNKDSTSSDLLNRKLTLKLAPSKQNRYPANTHYIPSSNSAIIIPKSDAYRPCQLLLSKKACWMFALMLTIVTILTSRCIPHPLSF